MDESRIKPVILICTQDIDFCLLLDHILQSEGVATSLAQEWVDIRRLVADDGPDAIMLDCRGHPDLTAQCSTAIQRDGAAARIPLIVLVDTSASRHPLELTKAGADHVFNRPIVPVKFIESLRGLLAGVSDGQLCSRVPKTMHYADVSMDLCSYRVWRGGRNIHLSPIEFKMLQCLLERPEQVVTREELHKAAWQRNVHVGPRTIDVHIGHLRRMLCADSGHNLIRTVRSMGYALCRQAPDARHASEHWSSSAGKALS